MSPDVWINIGGCVLMALIIWWFWLTD